MRHVAITYSPKILVPSPSKRFFPHLPCESVEWLCSSWTSGIQTDASTVSLFAFTSLHQWEGSVKNYTPSYYNFHTEVSQGISAHNSLVKPMTKPDVTVQGNAIMLQALRRRTKKLGE